MSVRNSENNIELEEEGEDELELIAIRYTGGRSIYNNPALRQQGRLPTVSALQGRAGEPGPWEICLVPSQGLGWLENHADIEVAYDRETLAEALLEKNTLPDQLFGSNINQDAKDRVLDKLGLETVPRRMDAIRETLADIAGEDVDPGEEATEETFDYDLTRSELQQVTDAFDHDLDLESAGVTDMEGFLLDQDDSKVRRLVGQLNSGEEPTLSGESEAADFDPDEFVDRTPVSEVADDIEAGVADAALGSVEEAEAEGRDRTTVYEAVADRQQTLSEEGGD